MSNKTKEIIVEEEINKIDNERQTSAGVSVDESFDHYIPTDKYNITKVLEDTLLCEPVDDNTDDQGFVETEGGILLKDDDGSEQHLFKVVRVLMAGQAVKEVKVGDLVVVSKTSGLRMLDFDGKETFMIREAGVFMVVTEK